MAKSGFKPSSHKTPETLPLLYLPKHRPFPVGLDGLIALAPPELVPEAVPVVIDSSEA
jgi:hypothetical protein